MSDLIGASGAWIVETIDSFGYGGVAVLMALSNLFLLLPSQVVLPLAGFLVGRGDLSFPLVLLAVSAGTLTSAMILYSICRCLGEERVRWLVRRLGRYAPVN